MEKPHNVVTTEAAVTGGNEKEVGTLATLARIDVSCSSCDWSDMVVQWHYQVIEGRLQVRIQGVSLWILHVPPGVCEVFFFFTQTIYLSISLYASIDEHHSLPDRSLPFQSVPSWVSTGWTCPRWPRRRHKAPLALPNPPAGNPLRRHMEATARRSANVDAIRLRKHLQGRSETSPLFPPTTHFLLLLITPSVPSIITMSPAPPVGKVYPRRT